MKTQEELKHELYEQTFAVENTIMNLDKANMLLNLWITEYVFTDQPDLGEAVKHWTSKPSEERNIKGEQSVKWFHEYRKIVGLVDIVSDYVFESKKLLEKAVYGEKMDKSA